MILEKVNVKEGEFWVDKNAFINEGDGYIHHGFTATGEEYWNACNCHKPTRKIEGREELFVDGMFAKDCWKVIAQSVNNLLPIEISYVEYPTTGKDWNDEDMRKMFEAGIERGYWMYGGESEYHDGDPILEGNAPNFEVMLKSLQPKIKSIEIEMITEYNIRGLWQSSLLPSQWADENPKRRVPVTYEKDGKTFLKIKIINYEEVGEQINPLS